jgi:hypothetical protein
MCLGAEDTATELLLKDRWSLLHRKPSLSLGFLPMAEDWVLFADGTHVRLSCSAGSGFIKSDFVHFYLGVPTALPCVSSLELAVV